MGIKSLETGIEQPNTDTLGGDYTLNSGSYAMRIDVAYFTTMDSGSQALNLVFKAADGGKAEIRQTLYVTTGTEKGNNGYYLTKTGKKVILSDRQKAEQICQICCEQPLSALATEMKTVKIWDWPSRSNLPTEVEVVTDLVNKPILLGIRKIHKNKQAKNDKGQWVATPEDQTINEVHKVWYPSGLSTGEKDDGQTEGKFIHTWKTKHHADYIEEMYKSVGGVTTGSPAAVEASVDDDLFKD